MGVNFRYGPTADSNLRSLLAGCGNSALAARFARTKADLAVGRSQGARETQHLRGRHGGGCARGRAPDLGHDSVTRDRHVDQMRRRTAGPPGGRGDRSRGDPPLGTTAVWPERYGARPRGHGAAAATSAWPRARPACARGRGRRHRGSAIAASGRPLRTAEHRLRRAGGVHGALRTGDPLSETHARWAGTARWDTI